jgi:hypothetical protein
MAVIILTAYVYDAVAASVYASAKRIKPLLLLLRRAHVAVAKGLDKCEFRFAHWLASAQAWQRVATCGR